MLTDLELMNLHVRALSTHDDNSKMLSVNEPSGAPVPAARLFLGRTRAGSIWRFRADVPDAICAELERLCADEPLTNLEINEPPKHLDEYVALLERHAPVRAVSGGGLAYCFTELAASHSNHLVAVTEENAETVLRGGFEKLLDEPPAWQPFVALIEDDKAVSVCRSVRISPAAHEAGVETLPDYRGKGYASEVTAEWARLVQAAGAVPLYSTSWENHASQAVAGKLKLKCYGVNFDIA